ncbi:hypothetical protein BCR34DRAFT_84324 [Clohesyomyces aquaticus]|uniref:F-box domain-containing protein n=1 Tax=Clohesyomyces aquaticus TaxID=1231657 RepID=A0A1Y1YW33_9PLEO|nr:hypothetical protein BCR34DRAFT_84324 [Clohesyomyces aquaticus]
MGLLDLPPELFAPIINKLVTDVNFIKASAYRTVCKAFAAAILHDIVALQHAEAFQNKSLESTNQYKPKRFLFFIQHGRVLLRHQLHTDRAWIPELFLESLRRLIELLVAGMKKIEATDREEEYTAVICNSSAVCMVP